MTLLSQALDDIEYYYSNVVGKLEDTPEPPEDDEPEFNYTPVTEAESPYGEEELEL